MLGFSPLYIRKPRSSLGYGPESVISGALDFPHLQVNLEEELSSLSSSPALPMQAHVSPPILSVYVSSFMCRQHRHHHDRCRDYHHRRIVIVVIITIKYYDNASNIIKKYQ